MIRPLIRGFEVARLRGYEALRRGPPRNLETSKPRNPYLACLLQDLAHAPALALRQRPRLLDDHPVADVDAGVLRVREELAGALDVLQIHGVPEHVLDRHDDGLLHLVRD